MARIRRVVIPNTPHHITQRGVRSMNIFFKDEDYEYYKIIKSGDENQGTAKIRGQKIRGQRKSGDRIPIN